MGVAEVKAVEWGTGAAVVGGGGAFLRGRELK